eukprot:TRINITY_DN36298_c0_g1_i1.p1 TRINITY_DN36298_c0_g1~~TRINITY_DN36298_c0_g1_i1.p1  ORF type:complete len:219 (-),score=28.02 TRINITY_DN36298_c0_g1_i1:47-703(-)
MLPTGLTQKNAALQSQLFVLYIRLFSFVVIQSHMIPLTQFSFFFFNDTATTEIYTLHIVGSVRCVQETEEQQLQLIKKLQLKNSTFIRGNYYTSIFEDQSDTFVHHLLYTCRKSDSTTGFLTLSTARIKVTNSVFKNATSIQGGALQVNIIQNKQFAQLESETSILNSYIQNCVFKDFYPANCQYSLQGAAINFIFSTTHNLYVFCLLYTSPSPRDQA